MNITPDIRLEYLNRFRTLQLHGFWTDRIHHAVQRVLDNRRTYETIEQLTKVPWFVVGLINEMESGSRLDCHLHNGDSLSRRTVHEPRGRPKTGTPPFTWTASAVDALTYDELTRWTDWSLSGLLWKLECFNGLGHRKYHTKVPTPYLWSGALDQPPGKYVADGVWDARAVSDQVGAAVILKELVTRGLVKIKEA